VGVDSTPVLCTDRTYPLDDPPEVVWHALEQVDGYARWWPWLRHLDAQALSVGAQWAARIRVPVPWSLRIELDLHDVRAPTTVRAVVAGDVEGTAAVTVAPAGTGSTIRLRSALVPRHRMLRGVNQLAPSVSRRLHDHVIDTAFRQFAARDRPGDRRTAR
jgi:uncharacterized protein YndB with AHSA1/START domain